jgi:predicted NAD/FAD-binding protein
VGVKTLRIGIVGAGVAGLYLADLLHPHHDIHVFEAGAYPGGHTNTVDVDIDGHSVAVDTGFIVHNDRNYPLFVDMIERLGVAAQDGDMSFSMSCELSGLEYCGTSLNTMFAQRSNIVRPRFLNMLREVLRFNGLADQLLRAPAEQNLAGFLAEHRFNGPVVDDYLVPMAAAIWSSKPTEILDFPAAYFGHFFANHGLLTVNDRPQWRTVVGGSRNYVAPLIAPFVDRIHLNQPVAQVLRDADGAEIRTAEGHSQRVDAVVFACHSDQALAMLAAPSPTEREVLGQIPFQPNDTVLHTDACLMPKRRLAWASWNYHRYQADEQQVSLTYDMSHLQQLSAPQRLFVSLNATDRINPDAVLRRIQYEHPVYNTLSVHARGRWREISNTNSTHYCGAYWGYGFHEDGLRSAVAVANDIDSGTDMLNNVPTTGYA